MLVAVFWLVNGNKFLSKATAAPWGFASYLGCEPGLTVDGSVALIIKMDDQTSISFD